MILEIVISLMAVAAFAFALWWSKIVPVARDALTVTITGLSSMMDSELDDDAKEAAVRSAGLSLIVASFSIFWRFTAALAAAAAPILVADAVGLVSRSAVLELMLRWDYIIIVSIVAVVLSRVLKRRPPTSGEPVAEPNRYSMADRSFHAMAFSTPAVLKAASWLEDRLLPDDRERSSASPIFITSLARGGTTALLNAMHDIPGIATHIYRDMPFVTAPVLWGRLSGGEKRNVDRHQRAHGDGLEIDLDSPEAFEEVVWKVCWPEKFRERSIPLWDVEDRQPGAEQFLERHMQKVIRARLAQNEVNAAEAVRYCSKNNGNIARVPYLMDVFPDCRIVIPVRRPECHAASLLRQHRNFLELQAEDEFVLRYMRDIGHYEFGLIHKPIRFPGFDSETLDSNSDDYWLNYWIHAFRDLLRYADRCIFVLQDDLRASPQATMDALCTALELAPGQMQFSAYFHSAPDRSGTDVYDRRLYAEASDLYREIESRAHSGSLPDTMRPVAHSH